MPLKKHVLLLKERKESLGSRATARRKVTLKLFTSYHWYKVVLLLLLELAYLAGWNVCPRGIHHSNPSVRCTGEQLVPGRTKIGGNLFLSFLSFFFFFYCFLSLLSLFPLFFFSFVFFSCLWFEKKTSKDIAVFVFTER